MDLTQFKAGQPFTWNGHFQRLAKFVLHYSPQTELLISSGDNNTWMITGEADHGVHLFHQQFGKLYIAFNKCTPHYPQSA